MFRTWIWGKVFFYLYVIAVSLYSLNESRDRYTEKWNSNKRTLNTSLKKYSPAIYKLVHVYYTANKQMKR